MWETFLARAVFDVGDRGYQWIDVILDAMCHGTWAPFETQLRLGVALEQRASVTGALPDDAAVQAAGNEFRYRRELLAAADMMGWLDAAGLTLDDWIGFLQRELLRAAGPTDGAASARLSDDALLLDAARADGICSGCFRSFAEAFAGRAAAVAREAQADLAPASAPGARRELIGPLAREWFPSWAADDLEARASHVCAVASRFDELARASLTTPALERLVRQHALDWLRVDLVSLSLRDEASAREAVWCLRLDGMSVDDVAAASRAVLARRSLLVEEAEAGWREPLRSAGVGELIGPLPQAARWAVVTIEAKRAATLDDTTVRRRAEAEAIATLASSAGSLVRWQAVA